MTRIFAWFVLLSTITACGPKIIFDKEVKFEKQQWSKSQKINFEFEVTDTIKKYDLILNVKTLENYRFQNLYISIDTRFPEGKVSKDVVSLELNGGGGNWNGKCSGGLCEIPILLQQGISFKYSGNYSIDISQYSRLDTIEGLQALTLRIEEAGDK